MTHPHAPAEAGPTERRCARCAAPLARRSREQPSLFRRRRYCDAACQHLGQRKATPEQEAELVAAVRAGATLRAAAELIGVKYSTAENILVRHGVRRRRGGRSAQVREMLTDQPELANREIARRLNVSADYVRNLRNEVVGQPDPVAASLDLPTPRQREEWRRASASERALFAPDVRQHLESANA